MFDVFVCIYLVGYLSVYDSFYIVYGLLIVFLVWRVSQPRSLNIFFIVPGSLEKFCLQNRTACLCVLSSVIIFCRQCGSQDDVAYSRIGRTTAA